jgi:hypothetical protein
MEDSTMSIFSLLAQASPAEGGFSFEQMLRDIPTDPASVFVYVLILASVAVIWRGNRRRPPSLPGV